MLVLWGANATVLVFQLASSAAVFYLTGDIRSALIGAAIVAFALACLGIYAHIHTLPSATALMMAGLTACVGTAAILNALYGSLEGAILLCLVSFAFAFASAYKRSEETGEPLVPLFTASLWFGIGVIFGAKPSLRQVLERDEPAIAK